MDVNEVIARLDSEDSDDVKSFSSELLDLLEPLEEKEESEDENLPKSKVFTSLHVTCKLTCTSVSVTLFLCLFLWECCYFLGTTESIYSWYHS